MKYYEILRNVALFDGINDIDLESVLKCLGATYRLYRKQSYIFSHDEKINTVGIIISGKAQIIKEDYAGNRNIIGEVSQGELFGETIACARLEKSPVTVLAVADCEIMFIEFKKIITICSSSCVFHTKLIENMLKIVAIKNLFLNSKIEILSKKTIREKLFAYFVSQMGKENSNKFIIPFNRNQLADFLCVDRSAMSRELCKLRDAGVLNFERNEFEILNI